MPEYKGLTNELKSDLYSNVSPVKNAMPRRSFLKDISKYVVGTLGAAVLCGSIALSTACNPHKETDKYVKINPILTAEYTSLEKTGVATMQSENSYVFVRTSSGKGPDATGTVTYIGNGMNKTYNFGEEADLGSVKEGSGMTFDEVRVNVTNALPITFRNMYIKPGDIYHTDALDPTGFNLEHFISFFCNSVNYFGRWNVNKVDCSFNPDSDGSRLDKNTIDGVKLPVLEMMEDSDGFIQTVTFSDKNYPDDASRPSDGEVRVYKDADSPTSVANTTYGETTQVRSSKVWFKFDNLGLMAYNETKDAFYIGNQGGIEDRELQRRWYRFTFKRPAGNDYRLYSDHEEQTGFRGTRAQGPIIPDMQATTQAQINNVSNIFSTNSPDHISPSEHIRTPREKIIEDDEEKRKRPRIR